MALAFSLEQLCAVVDPIRVEGSTTAELSNIASLDSAREGDLAFLGNEKYHAQVASCNASAILVPADYAGSAPKENQDYVFVEKPSYTLALICAQIEAALWPKPPAGTHPSALVAASAKIGKDVSIGAFCVVGENAEIGDGAVIEAQATIGRGVSVGAGTRIESGVRIGAYTRIGARVHILPNALAPVLVSATLGGMAAILALIVGLVLGSVAALCRGRWPDRLGMAFAVSGISMPPFALGILLMEVFSVWLGWFPTVGAESWRHYVLPSITLGAGVAAVMARFTRSALIEVLSEDYVRTARAKGLPARQVLSRHALRNALIPVVTMMGLQFGFLLGGSIVVEKVFNWPGMGRLLVDAVEMRDYPVMQTCVLLFSMEFLLINLAVDLLYGWLNPSIRYGNK